MNAPTRLLETLISQGRLRTSDNPVLNWMAGNCTVRTNSDGYIKISKPGVTSPHRVDGMVALVMALALANEAESGVKTPEPEIIVL
jgi:phage terminase large subunit-like protein